VANTLEDDKVDKVAEMDVIATKDPRFGNEDLNRGSGSEELPHLGKKKTSPTCVVTKVIFPFTCMDLIQRKQGI
jgi:hypothetical protein